MKVTFFGTGEAFDENTPAASILIQSETKLLLDCGYSSPPQIWKYTKDPNFIDAIFISHLHSDHYFGLPPLLKRMVEEKRKKTLTIVCYKGEKKKIIQVLNFGYRGIQKNSQYPINFIEVKPTQKIKYDELFLSFAPTIHSIPNLAIRVAKGNISISYSGDGLITKKSEDLYIKSHLLVHDGYLFDRQSNAHSNMKQVVDMCQKQKIKKVAFTHIHREEKNRIPAIKKKLTQKGLQIYFPKPGDEITV